MWRASDAVTVAWRSRTLSIGLSKSQQSRQLPSGSPLVVDLLCKHGGRAVSSTVQSPRGQRDSTKVCVPAKHSGTQSFLGEVLLGVFACG